MASPAHDSIPDQSDDTARDAGFDPPLSRNRAFTTLWVSLLLSELSGELAVIAFPLLILFTTGSAGLTGLVVATAAIARMAATVPAGIAADRGNRARLMIALQVTRVLGMGSLALTLGLGGYHLAQLIAVALVEGVCAAAFEPVENAALAQVVPAGQLSQALGRNAARPFVATLAGPAAAGALYAVGRELPFVAATVLLLVSTCCLLTLRLPPAESGGTGAPRGRVTRDLAEGLRWVAGKRLIRTTLLWLMLSQLVFSALVVIMLAASGEQDLGPGAVGLMMTCVGVGGLLGAVCAAPLYSALPPAVLVLGFSWLAPLLVVAMASVPVGVAGGALLGALAFGVPPVMTAVMTAALSITPDRMRGRLSGVIGLCTGGVGALGSLVGGLTLAAPRYSLWGCAGFLALVAVGATLSRTLRRFPRIGTGAFDGPGAPDGTRQEPAPGASGA